MNYDSVQEHLGRGVGFSLLLHLLFLVLAWYALPVVGQLLSPLQGHAEKPTEPEVVLFRFQDIIADVSETSRVEEAPDTPILGRFNSQAADMVPGEADTPVPEGGEIGMDNSIAGTGAETDVAGSPGEDLADATPPAAAMPPEAARGSGEGTHLEPEGSQKDVPPGMLDALPSSAEQLVTGRRAEPSQKPGYGARRSGDFQDAGALAFGEYAFSTRAWDYEPYWVHMRAKLYGAWIPPVAYTTYGIIQGGWTVVRVVVHRDGTISDAEVVDSDGHESLHRASLAAMVGAAPFRPLPPDFPEDNLVVTVRFVYLPAGAARPRDAP
jgi:TonB family protein